MFNRITGSTVVRSYDKHGDFIKEVNIIEFEIVPFVDWWIIATLILIGSFFIGHYV